MIERLSSSVFRWKRAFSSLASNRSSLVFAPTAAQEVPELFVARPMEPHTIPLIDMDAPDAAAQICAACQSIGFLNIANHGVSDSVISRAENATRAIFRLSLEDKCKLPKLGEAKVYPPTCRGFSELSGEALDPTAPPDLKEFFDLGPEQPEQKNPRAAPFHGPNPWPEEQIVSRSVFRDPLEEYIAELTKLAQRLLQLIAEGLKLPAGKTAFAEHFQDPVIIHRLIHYPPQCASGMISSHESQELGAGAHTDYGALTILRQMDEPGLQIRDPQTNMWVWAPTIPGTFTINIGDCLQHWTAGLFQSTLHRVVNVNGTDRHSMAFFYDPDFDALIDPRKLLGLEVVDCISYRGYDPFIAGHNKLAKYESVWDGEYGANHEALGKDRVLFKS